MEGLAASMASMASTASNVVVDPAGLSRDAPPGFDVVGLSATMNPAVEIRGPTVDLGPLEAGPYLMSWAGDSTEFCAWNLNCASRTTQHHLWPWECTKVLISDLVASKTGLSPTSGHQDP